MTRRLILATSAALSAGAAFPPAPSAAPLPVCPVSNGQTASYDILRGGDVIGHQTVRYGVTGTT